MAITFIRLANNTGMKAVFDESVMRNMELYDRLHRGEEIEFVLELKKDGTGMSIKPVRPGDPGGCVLRLRTDGRAEVVFDRFALEPDSSSGIGDRGADVTLP